MSEIDRDREPGLQPDVLQEHERTRINARVQPEPDKCVEVPLDAENCLADRPLLPSPLPRGEPRRPDARHGGGRRDAPILERFPAQKAVIDSVDRDAELQRDAVN